MTSRRILCVIFLSLIIAFVLVGCAKCISTETSTVQVKITDEYYHCAHTTPVFNGKTTIIITHPATYKITVEYDGGKYSIFDMRTYNKYHDRVGEYVSGTLEKKKYDNGTETYDITELE